MTLLATLLRFNADGGRGDGNEGERFDGFGRNRGKGFGRNGGNGFGERAGRGGRGGHRGFDSGELIGAGLAAVALVAFLLLALWLWRRRKARNAAAAVTSSALTNAATQPAPNPMDSGLAEALAVLRTRYANSEIDRYDFLTRMADLTGTSAVQDYVAVTTSTGDTTAS